MALRTERQSAQMSKIKKNGGLDQYGTEPFEHQQFGTAGVEGIKTAMMSCINTWFGLSPLLLIVMVSGLPRA